MGNACSEEKLRAQIFESIRNSVRNNLVNQLGLFIDEQGHIRCKGRFKNSCLFENVKSPKLLPRKDHFSELVVLDNHVKLLHSGVSHTLSRVRQEYWLLKGRTEVRRIILNCRLCRRIEGRPYKLPTMAPLPKQRVTESSPFTFTGLDYLGPLYIKEGLQYKKVWVCLFTCLCVRAIHLELVSDMTSIQFLLALRRFVARRGRPTEIFCDNAPQFKLVKNTVDRLWRSVIINHDIKNYFSNERIKWNFIPQLSPWAGGFYERLVGIVKRSLRKSIGKVYLDIIQLQTILAEVEAVVNTRPIIYICDDIDQCTLTPAHFLTLNYRIDFPEMIDIEETDYIPGISSSQTLLETWKKGQRHLSNFWKVWKNEYLAHLRERDQCYHKNNRNKSECDPHIGDVVLIQEGQPRSQWRIGKIFEFLTSSDGEK